MLKCMAGAAVSTVGAVVVSTAGAGSTAVDLAGFMGIDFTMAGSTAIDFTITGFSSAERLHILGWAIIHTTTITTMASLTPLRHGITVPILQVITPT
jgi:hypothetical protein